MRHFKSTAFVLRHKNFGEADRFISFFTEGFGLLGVIAKGVRKIRSKRGGKLDILNKVEITWYQSSSGNRLLTEVETINTYSQLKKEPQSSQVALEIAALLLHFVPFEQPNRAAFQLFEAFIKNMNEQRDISPLYLPGFFLKLLSLTGEIPPLTQCIHCHNKHDLGVSVQFDSSQRACICNSCFQKNPYEFQGVFEIPFETLKLAAFLQRAHIDDIKKIQVTEEYLTDLTDMQSKIQATLVG